MELKREVARFTEFSFKKERVTPTKFLHLVHEVSCLSPGIDTKGPVTKDSKWEMELSLKIQVGK